MAQEFRKFEYSSPWEMFPAYRPKHDSDAPAAESSSDAKK